MDRKDLKLVPGIPIEYCTGTITFNLSKTRKRYMEDKQSSLQAFTDYPALIKVTESILGSVLFQSGEKKDIPAFSVFLIRGYYYRMGPTNELYVYDSLRY